jgi:hypothetical protein
VALFGTGSSPKIEAQIDGTWTDITSRVRGDAKVNITRGRANEQSRTTAQTCAMTLENADGFFSTRMPTSVNYGKIGKNTQVRVSAGTGDYYLKLPFTDDTSLCNVSTADKAVLDITGDIDIRAEIWPHSWRPGYYMIIASKWQATSNQRSWVLYLGPDGYLRFAYTTDGTLNTRTTLISQETVPFDSRKLAIRLAFDTNNGLGSREYTFYTSDSISGTWDGLGSTTELGGTTTIYSSSADLVVGGGDDTQIVWSDGMGFGGKVYKFELYSGISGTRVANMDATSRSLADTSWSDGLTTPNTWTINGVGRISTDRLRFWGELSSLPKQWDASGRDVYIPAQASGMIRRLTQGASPIRSAMYRNFTQYTPHGYWTFEDENGSRSAASAVSGGRAAAVTAVEFANATDLPGSVQTLAFTGSTSRIQGVSNSATNTGTASLVIYLKLSALPAAQATLISLSTNGTARRIDISLTPTAWRADLYDKDGASLGASTATISSITPVNRWIGYNLLLETSGADMNVSSRWDVVGGDFGGGVGPTTISSASVRPFSGFTILAANSSSYNDAQFGHMFLSTQNLDLTDDIFRTASNAYLGETAAARMDRLCNEEGIPFEITGFYDESETMGYQSLSTFMDLIYECWDADGGIGGEARDQLALTYRVRTDMERRSDLTLDYDSSHLSAVPEPTDDDQGVTNDVTVTREGGSSARAVITEGANSINEPPDGIGRYDTSASVNVAEDDRLLSIAGWMALVGSWDQDRYPQLSVSLHRSQLTSNALLTTEAIGLDLGDTVFLSGLPSGWLPPDDVSELVQGYSEAMDKFTWDITYNGTPAGPYQTTGLLDSDDFEIRLDANEHTIGTAIDSDDTTLNFHTPLTEGSRWIIYDDFPLDFPFDIKVGGEVMTVSEIRNSVEDVFSRTSASSWGSADSRGGAYTAVNGSASDYSVSGGLGRIAHASTGVSRYTVLTGITGADVDMVFDTQVSATALTQSFINMGIARYTNTSNLYRAEVTFNTSGTVDARLRSVVSGVTTSLLFKSAILSYSAGTSVSCRFRIEGSWLRMRIWLTSGEEPAIWHASFQDTNLTSGSVGLGAVANTGNTNVGAESRFDNLEVRVPQIATVTRSVNDVVKSHAADTLVRLVKPHYIGR